MEVYGREIRINYYSRAPDLAYKLIKILTLCCTTGKWQSLSITISFLFYFYTWKIENGSWSQVRTPEEEKRGQTL